MDFCRRSWSKASSPWHHQSLVYGLNIKAAGEHHHRFVYIVDAGPGVMSYHDAVKHVRLNCLIHTLPGLNLTTRLCILIFTENASCFITKALPRSHNPQWDSLFTASPCQTRIEIVPAHSPKCMTRMLLWALITSAKGRCLFCPLASFEKDLDLALERSHEVVLDLPGNHSTELSWWYVMKQRLRVYANVIF